MTFVSTLSPVIGIEKILQYNPSGSILDLGCGNGRNSVYLSRLGKYNNISCVDIDPRALREAKGYLEGENISLELNEKDLKEYETDKKFDIVISSFVLPYLFLEECFDLIEKMQNMTNFSGLNYISTYVDPKVLSHTDKIKTVFGPRDLKRFFYNDWDVLDSSVFNAKFSSGDVFKGTYMIARKQ